MSDMENISLEKQVVYELCVRNFNKEGTFDSLRQELKRIWAMGVDIICLLPVYNMEDPENPDPELGDEEQFQALVEAIHRYRMKCVLDVTLTGEDRQIPMLLRWAALVDGFRCVNGEQVSESCAERVLEAVAGVKADCIWLAENDRSGKLDSSSRDDAYRAFRGYLAGENSLAEFARIETEEGMQGPRICYLERRDTPRSRKLIGEETGFLNWICFHYFRKGMTLLCAGQEMECVTYSDPDKKDPINWNEGMNNLDLIYGLYLIRQEQLPESGDYRVEALEGNGLLALWQSEQATLVGVFAVGGEPVQAQVPLADGNYENLLDGDQVRVRGGKLDCMGTPIMIRG